MQTIDTGPARMPLVTLLDGHFFSGPNIHADRSSVLLRTELGEHADSAFAPPSVDRDALDAMGRDPRLAGLARLVGSELSGRKTPARAADLMLALAARLQERFVLTAQPGRIASRNGSIVLSVVPADSEAVGARAWRFACSAVLSLTDPQQYSREADELAKLAEDFGRVAKTSSPDILTLALARSARKLGLPVYSAPLGEMRIGQGARGRYVRQTLIEPVGHFAVTHAGNKWATLRLMKQAGLPTLPSSLAASEEQAVQIAAKLAGPVAVKPASSDKGVGVSVDLQGEDAVRVAYRTAARNGPLVLIEKFAKAHDHRLLVVDGKLIAAARRIPAQVTGDGKRTVAQLVDELNSDPRRGTGYSDVLERIVPDRRMEALLARQSLALDGIPAEGRTVRLSNAGNISQGGTAVPVGMHPDNVAAAERAARVLRLDVAGVDFLSPDPSRSWREGEGWILEVNAPPGLRPHWVADPEQDVVSPIVRSSFPDSEAGRIPVVGVTGSLGKTTTCQVLAHIGRKAGKTVGLTTTQGTWSGTFRIRNEDSSGGAAALQLLADPTVEMGVFELARGSLLKWGMALEELDVAIVLNVHDNHIGLDGIETQAQLAAIKSLPARHARKAVVLNAGDPLVLAMQKPASAPVTLFSFSADNDAIARHRENGGLVATRVDTAEGPAIRLQQATRILFEMPLSQVPASRCGRSRSVTENVLAAVCAAYHLGFSQARIRDGLSDFTSDIDQNPARHNWIEGLPFELVMNEVDGPKALEDIADTFAAEPVDGTDRIVLVAAGNRPDEWIREIGRAAGRRFDVYHCAEAPAYLRGRQPGAVPALLAAGLRDAGVPEDAIQIHPIDEDYLTTVLETARAGDRVLLTTDTLEELRRKIDAFLGRQQESA